MFVSMYCRVVRCGLDDRLGTIVVVAGHEHETYRQQRSGAGSHDGRFGGCQHVRLGRHALRK
jgi:hypothetical protein